MIIKWLRKIAFAAYLKRGFPAELTRDVFISVNYIPLKAFSDCHIYTSEWIHYILYGNTIAIPYRIYLHDISDKVLRKMTDQQRIILHCLYSRCGDGYTRQRHIEALLAADYPDWAIPYIYKVCDEYVVEILDAVYKILQPQGNERIKKFCLDNAKQFRIGYQRMISYWNEYYRYKYYRFNQYVGNKLFLEVLGYSRAIAKMQTH